MKLIYRGYQAQIISDLAKELNKSPTEMLYLMSELLRDDNSLLTKAAQVAQENRSVEFNREFKE